MVERARTREPALILMEGGGLPGQVFRLRTGRQIVGRRPECDIRVRERAVSGLHAELVRVNDTVTVSDLESTNGTLVNGMRIHGPVVLGQGALLKLGTCLFKFVDSLLEVEFTENLHARSITDQLTGAYNRAYLLLRVGLAMDTATQERPVSLIAFDYDEFKMVNDLHGHAAGDAILEAASRRIRETVLRDRDVFARTGGEEFAILLPETSIDTASEIAETLRASLEAASFPEGDETIRLTASFGVATVVAPVESAESFLARADALLYESKRTGRNRISRQ